MKRWRDIFGDILILITAVIVGALGALMWIQSKNNKLLLEKFEQRLEDTEAHISDLEGLSLIQQEVDREEIIGLIFQRSFNNQSFKRHCCSFIKSGK